MRTLLIVATVSLALAVVPLGAQSPNDLFQKALAAERGDGNLREAISLYERVAKQAGADRALAARALVRMAECHQKLGNAESERIYRQIVDQFADQAEAVSVARARLAPSGGLPGTRRDHLVWSPPRAGDTQRVSTDGRFISYSDQDGRLMLRDLASNTDRELTAAVANYAQYAGHAALSRDGRQVVYRWWNDPEATTGLRIAPIPTAGHVRPKEFYSFKGVRGDAWFDWSPDGRFVAIGLSRGDGPPEIGLVTVAVGAFRTLKTFAEAYVPQRIFFSPDSQFVAYSLPAVGGDVDRDVHVLALADGREVAVPHPGNDTLVGWSPDGSRLLFTSDRTGFNGVWSVSWESGAPRGAPQMLQAGASGLSLGVTTAGAVYLRKQVTTRDFAIAPLDLDKGTLDGSAAPFARGFLAGASVASWSPNGQYLAYTVECRDGCLAVRSVTTGDVRRLPVTASSVPSWSPDSRSLLLRGRDAKGRDGLFTVDVQSGSMTAVVMGNGLLGPPQWSPSATRVFFVRNDALLERDLAAGIDREVAKDVWSGDTRVSFLSPNGEYFLASVRGARGQPAALSVVSVRDGARREFFRVEAPEFLGFARWTPDSAAVLVVKQNGTRSELWRAPVGGGTARRLDIDPSAWLDGSGSGNRGFTLSPDGRQIAFQTGGAGFEVWALENLVPLTRK